MDRSFYHSLPANIQSLQQSLDHYELTHSYGLFRRMTGVGGRPEIIIEGANEIDEEWKVISNSALLFVGELYDTFFNRLSYLSNYSSPSTKVGLADVVCSIGKITNMIHGSFI